VARAARAFADRPHDLLDGLTVDLGDAWFNLRPSNTEPLLRLNVEADTAERVEAVVHEVLATLATVTGAADGVPPTEDLHD
jgi:phosphomannomutase